jgi:Tfp pilus assembly protein PilF
VALFAQFKYDEAIDSCDKAIEIDPKYAKAWAIKATAQRSLGHIAEGDATFAKAMELMS